MSPASRLRNRASAIRELGGQSRRSWDPDPQSWHYSVYVKWQEITDHQPERENFCHYWRVALIWGPLALLKQRAGKAWEHRWVQNSVGITFLLVVLGALGYVISLFPDVVLAIVLVVAAAAYLIFAVLTTVQVATELFDNEDEKTRKNAWPWLHKQEFGIKCLFAFLSVPVIVALTAIATVLIGFFGFLAWAFDDKDFGSTLLNFFLEVHPPVRWLRWLRPWLIIPIGIGISAVYSKAMLHFVEFIGVLVGIVAVIVIVVLFFSWLADVLRRNSQVKASTRSSTGSVASLSFDTAPQPVKRSAPTKRRRRPLRAIGDFFALLWSIVVTRKWKVCPIVNISAPSTDTISADAVPSTTN